MQVHHFVLAHRWDSKNHSNIGSMQGNMLLQLRSLSRIVDTGQRVQTAFPLISSLVGYLWFSASFLDGHLVHKNLEKDVSLYPL